MMMVVGIDGDWLDEWPQPRAGPCAECGRDCGEGERRFGLCPQCRGEESDDESGSSALRRGSG